MSQVEIDFVHEHEASPSGNEILQANRKGLNKQARTILEELIKRERVSMLDSGRLKIGVFHTRIYNARKFLKERLDVTLDYVRINENDTSCNQYWIPLDKIEKVEKYWLALTQ